MVNPSVGLHSFSSLCFREIRLMRRTFRRRADVQMTIMQNLQYTEHLSEPMAELITVFSKEFDNQTLGEKVLGYVLFLSSQFVRVLARQLSDKGVMYSEIADKNFSSQDTKSPRSFSKFLIKLAEISPRLVRKQIVLLQKHLDSEVSSFFPSLPSFLSKSS